jgi:hypothetical protein
VAADAFARRSGLIDEEKRNRRQKYGKRASGDGGGSVQSVFQVIHSTILVQQLEIRARQFCRPHRPQPHRSSTAS